jgi:hypothetical protein
VILILEMRFLLMFPFVERSSRDNRGRKPERASIRPPRPACTCLRAMPFRDFEREQAQLLLRCYKWVAAACNGTGEASLISPATARSSKRIPSISLAEPAFSIKIAPS